MNKPVKFDSHIPFEKQQVLFYSSTKKTSGSVSGTTCKALIWKAHEH